MAGMNGDMAGAAIVTGILHTVAKTGIPLHIIGLVPSTDNRPGGNAYTRRGPWRFTSIPRHRRGTRR